MHLSKWWILSTKLTIKRETFLGMGPIRSSIGIRSIWSSVGIGSDTNVIHGSEISNPICRDLQSMSHVCALMLSAEMNDRWFLPVTASWLQTVEWISWMKAWLNEKQSYDTCPHSGNPFHSLQPASRLALSSTVASQHVPCMEIFYTGNTAKQDSIRQCLKSHYSERQKLPHDVQH